MSHHSIIHFQRRFHRYDLNIGRRWFDRHRTADNGHIGSPVGEFICHRIPHLAGWIIADEPHRIYFLIRRTCSYQHPLSFHRLTFGEIFFDDSEDGFRLFHSAFSYQVAGKFPFLRFYDNIAIRNKFCQITMCGRMLIHIQIHSRCYEHRTLRWQIRRDEHIVGNAICHLANRRRCCRRDDHSVRPQSEIHMTVPAACVCREKLTYDRLSAQGR